MIEHKKCKHEMDESTMEFVQGKGYIGICKLCGEKIIKIFRTSVKPRTKPKMSKKQRLRERNKLKQ